MLGTVHTRLTAVNRPFRSPRHTSVSRIGHEYNPTEEYTPVDGRESRVIGSIPRIVHVFDVSHFRRMDKRFVEESDGYDPSQSQMAL